MYEIIAPKNQQSQQPTHQPLHSLDAEQIDDFLPRAIQPSVVLMNPPFSVSIGRSQRHPDACFKHLRSALLRLQPHGRLVAIVAHWLSPEKQPEYFATLPAQLRLSVFLQGSFYRHHGTTMDTRLLVFDKLPQPDRSIKSFDGFWDIPPIGQLIANIVPARLPIGVKAIAEPEPATIQPAISLAVTPIPSQIPAPDLSSLPLFQFAMTNHQGETPGTISVVEEGEERKEREANLPPTPPTPPPPPLIRLTYTPAPEQEDKITEGVYQPLLIFADPIDHTSDLHHSLDQMADRGAHENVNV